MRCRRSARPRHGASIDGVPSRLRRPRDRDDEFQPGGRQERGVSRENLRRAAEIRTTSGEITRLEDRRSATRSAHVHQVTRGAIIVGAGALALSAALVLLFGAWVARGVARPVRETTKAASQVAAGDFGVRLDEHAAGEVAALVSGFNSMARSLDSGRREVLAQNQQLRESEQHKRDLISMVSHELRTPLASVLGFTTLLLERDFAPDEQRRYLEIVDTQARRLAALAGDFLDVQLLEGGAMRLEPRARRPDRARRTSRRGSSSRISTRISSCSSCPTRRS